MITKINNKNLFYHSINRVCFLIICKAICHFHARAIPKKEKSVVSFTHEQDIICSQTQVDDIANEQIIIIRQLLQVTWWTLDQSKGRKICIER